MTGKQRGGKIAAQLERRKFLSYAGAGVLAGAAGMVVSRSGYSMPGLGKVDRRKLLEYPVLSMKEKERRWNNAWKFMQDHKVDALLIPQRNSGGNSPSNYFTNDPSASTVFFPMQGARDPIVFYPGRSEQQVDWVMRSERDGQPSWIRDYRFAKGGARDLVATIKERGMANSRIGTINLLAGARDDRENPNPMADYLKSNLPGVTFVELYDEFVPLWHVKSEEELVMLRKAALALELATEVFVEASKPRATIADVHAAMLHETLPYGVDLSIVSIYTGPEGGRGTRWLGRGYPPPVIQKGYLVHTETIGTCGHMRGDIQVTVSVGEPSQEIATLGRLARESYEAGLRQVRPGNTFRALAQAMEEPNRRGGAWNLTPFVHTLNPQESRSMIREGMWENYTGIKERLGEARVSVSPILGGALVLQPGFTFAFEPNSCFGSKYVNIGGTVVCTQNGAEELNDMPNRLIVVDA